MLLGSLPDTSVKMLHKMESNVNPPGSTLTNAFLIQNTAAQCCSPFVISRYLPSHLTVLLSKLISFKHFSDFVRHCSGCLMKVEILHLLCSLWLLLFFFF